MAKYTICDLAQAHCRNASWCFSCLLLSKSTHKYLSHGTNKIQDALPTRMVLIVDLNAMNLRRCQTVGVHDALNFQLHYQDPSIY